MTALVVVVVVVDVVDGVVLVEGVRVEAIVVAEAAVEILVDRIDEDASVCWEDGLDVDDLGDDGGGDGCAEVVWLTESSSEPKSVLLAEVPEAEDLSSILAGPGGGLGRAGAAVTALEVVTSPSEFD